MLTGQISSRGKVLVFWLMVCLAAVGMLLGLRFRVPAALAGSFAAAVAGIVVAIAGGGATWDAATTAAVSVLALQVGYVLGLLVSRSRRP